MRLKKLGTIHRSIWMANEKFNFPRCLVYTKLHSLVSESIQKNWLDASSFSWVSLMCSGGQASHILDSQ